MRSASLMKDTSNSRGRSPHSQDDTVFKGGNARISPPLEVLVRNSRGQHVARKSGHRSIKSYARAISMIPNGGARLEMESGMSCGSTRLVDPRNSKRTRMRAEFLENVAH